MYSQYEATRVAVWSDEEMMPSLLELLTIYREKPAIFCPTATLVGILALEQPCRQVRPGETRICWFEFTHLFT